MCARCSKEKPRQDFAPSQFVHKAGRERCRECDRAAVAAWTAANRERKRANEAARRERIRQDPERLERERRRKRGQYQPRPVRQKQCEVCGETFSNKANNARFCGAGCRAVHAVVRKYGWTLDAYQASLASGVCDACGKPHKGRMSVDHDPVSGGRGLIHQRCNVGIAQAHHDPDELFRWSVYLVRHDFDLRELCVS